MVLLIVKNEVLRNYSHRIDHLTRENKIPKIPIAWRMVSCYRIEEITFETIPFLKICLFPSRHVSLEETRTF